MVNVARNLLIMLKIREATRDLIGNNISNKSTWVSKKLAQKNSEIVTNEHDEEIPKQRYISAK